MNAEREHGEHDEDEGDPLAKVRIRPRETDRFHQRDGQAFIALAGVSSAATPKACG